MATLLIFIVSCSFLQSLFTSSSSAGDTIATAESIRDGQTLVSAGGSFELGFFGPDNARRSRYLGIWYKKISVMRTVVWVANGENALTDSSGVLYFDRRGRLVLNDGSNRTLWSPNLKRVAENPVAELLDTGNLVIRDGKDADPQSFVWQSFECSGNTFLPGVKLGKNLVTGSDVHLVSWKSDDDPSPGEYTNTLDPSGFPQLFLRKGSDIEFRSGPWNGLRFSGMPNLEPNPFYTFKFVLSPQEIYYRYELVNDAVLSRMVLSPDGKLQRFNWVDRTKKWELYLSASMDDCDRYALCGAYGSCNINRSPPCKCLEGFVPRDSAAWNVSDWFDGCVRRVQLDCPKRDGFIRHPGVKLPDTRKAWVNMSMNLVECEGMCLSNCNCTAYANSNISGGGTGCLLWFGELIDIRDYTVNGQDLYVRVAASEAESSGSSNTKKHVRAIVAAVLSVGMFSLVTGIVLHALKKKKLQNKVRMGQNPDSSSTSESQDNDLDLPLFELATIYIATDNFSINNKVGQGGFGPVYKGKLNDGQEIAVKRLSRTSKQGLDEFKSEVKLIAKLQHRNLVRLIGCCIQDEEMMLIYEYMPNGSLDYALFDRAPSILLDWPSRFYIINGIARGLLYLHHDSRLRIIHRDLKASNILLDDEMNPKISDFGVARSFGGKEMEANTSRVVGTYGYMSPEYAIDGNFSLKSDVFSFGVLVLEIVSGKKNRGFRHPDHHLNLVGHVWTMFTEGKPLAETIDPAANVSSYAESEVLRCIHVGLLCVQQNPEDRPSMSTVVVMLSSENPLPQPKQPGFFTGRNLLEMADSSRSRQETCSTNEITLTLLEAR